MNIAVIGQQDIAGTEFIGSSFNYIIYITRNKNVDFIKDMLVEINHRGLIVAVMMVFIKALRHDLTVGKFINIHI